MTGPAGPQLDRSTVASSLEPLVRMMEADGYGLDVEIAGAVVALTVSATADACADCLVPPSLFRELALDQLRTAGVDVGADVVTVTYPDGSRLASG